MRFSLMSPFQRGRLLLLVVWLFQISVPLDAQGLPFIRGTTTNNTEIPVWEWTSSEISITDAPVGAVVDHMDVYYKVVHPCAGDVQLDLTNECMLQEYTLLDADFSYDCQQDKIETVTDITTFSGQPVNQTWILWAIDWIDHYHGYIDQWWIKIYYTIPLVPPHDEQTGAIVIEEGTPYHDSTMGATGDMESPSGWFDTKDVWHLYVPPENGLATISLEGSEFDTTLAVYDPCDQRVLASGDDFVVDDCDHPQLWSRLMMPVLGETPYLIRVAGICHEVGDYTLTVSRSSSDLPDIPHSPSPAHEARDIPLEVRLTWNGWEDSWSNIPAAASIPRKQKQTGSLLKVIYGTDDRVEEYEITDEDILLAGDATALIMSAKYLLDNQDGTYTLPTDTLADWYNRYVPVGGNPLCPDEPFYGQPTLGKCTCYLVAPDIVATGGHCMACPGDCNESAIVFGFVMLDASTPLTVLDTRDVYFCKELIGYSEGAPDWALVRLDRPVQGRRPLRLRRFEAVQSNQPLITIGHPLGLPRKYDMGGTVRDNSMDTEFEANLDVYQGCSGAPVLNVDTLEVEGHVVTGNVDFVTCTECTPPCDRSNRCPDSGCPYWEIITRATMFSSLIPSYDVYLGTDPNQLQRIGSYQVVPSLEPMTLSKGTTYYWYVVSRNIMGDVKGPMWSFTTSSSE